MKLMNTGDDDKKKVAPFAGAWIETDRIRKLRILSIVAPFAGAWIETNEYGLTGSDLLSLPSRERGLKRFQKSII